MDPEIVNWLAKMSALSIKQVCPDLNEEQQETMACHATCFNTGVWDDASWRKLFVDEWLDTYRNGEVPPAPGKGETFPSPSWL